MELLAGKCHRGTPDVRRPPAARAATGTARALLETYHGVRADVTTLVTAPQLSPNIMVSGYVYNTAAGTLDTVVVPTPVGKR